MDYALKAENRKKFQDKQKLKRKHLTQSDRKYIKEKYKALDQPQEKSTENDNNNDSAQGSDEEKNGIQINESKLEKFNISDEKLPGGKSFEKRKLQSNMYRYDKEQDEEFHNRVNKIVDDSLINDEIRAQLKEIALKKETEEANAKIKEEFEHGKVLTSANVRRKDLDSLTTKQLNELLTSGKVRVGQDKSSEEPKVGSIKTNSPKTPDISANVAANESDKRAIPTKASLQAPKSSVPLGLQEEQDFLDGLL
ncbi:hypothetical protein ACO0QE_000879 [Hanseniaspora vineae]